MYAPPKRLYKYFPPDRVDVLSTKRMRFSPLSAFNDPFEGRPEITGLAPDGALEKAVWEGIPKELENKYHEMPEAFRKQVSFDQFYQFCIENQGTIVKDLVLKFEPMIHHIAQSIPDQIADKVGVLCLSEVPDSLLMWAHYAASHTGFVVEFDSSHGYFDQRRSESDEFYHLRRVLYRTTRPSASLTEFDGPELFTVKSDHWAYENEWRIMKPLADAAVTIGTPHGEVHLFDYPPESIVSVTMGMRISKQIESTISELIASDPSLKHVALFKSYPDKSHFCIRRNQFNC